MREEVPFVEFYVMAGNRVESVEAASGDENYIIVRLSGDLTLYADNPTLYRESYADEAAEADAAQDAGEPPVAEVKPVSAAEFFRAFGEGGSDA